MDTKEIIDFLREEAKQYYDTSDDSWISDYLFECDTVSSIVIDSRRWWDTCERIVKVNGKLIMYHDATTTGDESAEDKGWSFDPLTLCEVEEYTETIVVKKYRKVTVDNSE